MKTYCIQFGTGSPTGFSGLAPTFLIFYNLATSATIAPPAISESPLGWGIYSFAYGTTQPIWFLADAATTSPGAAGRYVTGFLDPADRADEYGTSLAAISASIYSQAQSIAGASFPIGTTASLMGDSSTYPVDLFGYMKRIDSLLEGQQKFVKGTGVLSQYDLSGATLLSSRTITNSASLVTRT